VCPEDIPARLAQNVRTDSLPAVRLANLLTLAQEYPDRPETRETLRAACNDPDDEVRLRAAVEFGEEGREVLREIALREEAEDSHAARAIDALGERLTRQHAETILRQSLQRKRRATARAAIRALDRIGGAEVVPPLVPVLGEEDEELAAAAATALGESGEPAAEKPLVGALHRDSPELRVAMAEGLGRVGSAVAVAPLRELAMQHPLDLGLRRASRQAIAQIHSRLKGATSGQLALAEADSGQLSLADEEAHGRLSLEGAASIGRAVESSADEEEASSSAPEAPAPRKREEG
jgi:HEAT repeat protein